MQEHINNCCLANFAIFKESTLPFHLFFDSFFNLLFEKVFSLTIDLLKNVTSILRNLTLAFTVSFRHLLSRLEKNIFY